MNRAVPAQSASFVRTAPGTRFGLVLSPLAALIYPFILQAFHACVGTGASGLNVLAALLLLAAFAVPAIAVLQTMTFTALPAPTAAQHRARSLALLSVAAPPLFVLLGVVLYMLHSPVRDTWIWAVAWLLVIGAVLKADNGGPVRIERRPAPRWLAPVHGSSALAIIAVFLAIHLSNHATFILGSSIYMALMHTFRHVYRQPVLQPILVALMLFQAASGFWLLRGIAGRRLDRMKAMQVAAGAYLVAYIPSHMNSVFMFGRLYLGVDTGFDFAVGAPTGLVLDPWNIRLVPYYGLGVFFVLTHIAAGTRSVMLGHGVSRQAADRVLIAGATAAAALMVWILIGMCGGRLTFSA